MLEFRNLKIEDEHDLLILWKARLTARRSPQWDINSFVSDNNCRGIVLEDRSNGKIAGFGAIIFFQTPMDGLIGTIQEVAIDRQYGGQGWGRKLTQELIAIARHKKATSIWLTSNDKRAEAIHIYLTEGFIKKTRIFSLKN
ncbi:MAG: GNAT family N-acetyltransferase [Candidatus Falkowbacteria bacterium]